MIQRKAIRLKGWDYSQPGVYFLTVCAAEHKMLFGSVTVGDGACDVPQVRLSGIGQAVESRIADMETRYSNIRVDKYIVMPNHVHLLLRVEPGTSQAPSPTNSTVAKWISLWKRFCNRDCGDQLFQRGYYDHIVREQGDYDRIWEYIHTNPAKWEQDKYYTEEKTG